MKSNYLDIKWSMCAFKVKRESFIKWPFDQYSYMDRNVGLLEMIVKYGDGSSRNMNTLKDEFAYLKR